MTHQWLNRLSFGFTPQSLARLQKLGKKRFLDEQLQLQPKSDPALIARKIGFRFHSDKPVLHNKPFTYLDAPIQDLWKLNEGDQQPKRFIPTAEVFAHSVLHAAYSPWQLQEILVHFWHNHFHVNVSSDERVSITMPLYDKVIRQHCLGNFRAFLEAVAKSPAMLYYLDNANSKASPANENYARELLELHTLGRPAYLNDQHPQWDTVPKDDQGVAKGYIDADVYEVARAFTGWTVADGAWSFSGTQPNTGEFLYYNPWHDPYQKRILGVEFKAHQPPLADGRRVLDLLAAHPQTAHFVCTKLCRRLVSDHPPAALVEAAAALWLQHRDAPDQIRRVVRFIIESEHFEVSLGQKFKTPFELVISVVRGLNLNVQPNPHLQWMLHQMGQAPYQWASPDGYPDTQAHWSSSQLLLQRWNLLPKLLFSDWHHLFQWHPDELTPADQSSRQLVAAWLERLLGAQHDFEHSDRLVSLLTRGERSPDAPPLTYSDKDRRYRLAHVLALIMMTPQFQYR